MQGFARTNPSRGQRSPTPPSLVARLMAKISPGEEICGLRLPKQGPRVQSKPLQAAMACVAATMLVNSWRNCAPPGGGLERLRTRSQGPHRWPSHCLVASLGPSQEGKEMRPKAWALAQVWGVTSQLEQCLCSTRHYGRNHLQVQQHWCSNGALDARLSPLSLSGRHRGSGEQDGGGAQGAATQERTLQHTRQQLRSWPRAAVRRLARRNWEGATTAGLGRRGWLAAQC